jgi:hypothetical protein
LRALGAIRRLPTGFGANSRISEKPDLLSRINVIWPVQSLSKKYSDFPNFLLAA